MDSKIANRKLIEVKRRPTNKSFPVMCVNENQINSIAIVNEISEKLIDAFMPGPITLVMKKNKNLPEYITNGKETIAVRMATSNTIKELIAKVESPLYMTSANQSGSPEWTNLDEIEKACLLLDGIMEGKVSYSIASTIVDCTSEEVKILRLGPISFKQIKKVIDKK